MAQQGTSPFLPILQAGDPAPAPPALPAGEQQPSPGGAWESFSREPSPTQLPPGYGAFPSTSPLAEGGAAAAFTDFVAGLAAQQPQQGLQQGPPQASPFSELNPLRGGAQPASNGAASPFASPAGALAPQEAAPLYATPLAAGHPAPGAAAFATPDTQQQRAAAAAQLAAGAVDPHALAAAMQQLTIQQALAAQLAAAGGRGVQAPVLSPADPETAAAIARAQAQLEAAAASLVAAATARPAAPPALASPPGPPTLERSGGSVVSRASSMDARSAPFTARDHHVHANAPRLGRHLSAPVSHALGPLGAGEHLLQPRQPSRLSHAGSASAASSAPGSAPLTARSLVPPPDAEAAALQPLPPEDLERCEKMFAAKVGWVAWCTVQALGCVACT